MAEEDSGQEKTEDPTPKRLREAREKGDIPRSRELTATAVLLGAVASAFVFGSMVVDAMVDLIRRNFVLDRADIFDTNLLSAHFGGSLYDAFYSLIGVMGIMLFAALVGPIALGGWNFSGEALMPKGSRLDPLAGIKRMFSLKSLMELLKAIAKFLLIGGVAVGVLLWYEDNLLALGNAAIGPAVQDAVEIVLWSFLFMSSTMVVVTMIDVPFQVHEYSQKLKMTMQEVKDEMKETEGKPEVKGRIRQLQREMSQRKMMSEVPEADVVITNPTHYAVALKYDNEGNGAPRLVAKGADFMALKIREIAKENDVAIVSAPPLARALYYSTELEHEIPEGLYKAVAQVLAYVYQLQRYRRRTGEQPQPLREADFDIPDDLQVEPDEPDSAGDP